MQYKESTYAKQPSWAAKPSENRIIRSEVPMETIVQLLTAAMVGLKFMAVAGLPIALFWAIVLGSAVICFGSDVWRIWRI